MSDQHAPPGTVGDAATASAVGPPATRSVADATIAHAITDDPADAPAPPPGFTVERELGRGGMGVVYLARQTGLNRPVALKMMLGADRKAVIRFLAESEAVAAVRHPNVVEVYQFGEHDGRPFLALEYCPGGGLDARLSAGRLPPEEAAEILARVAAGVHAAHELGIVHRDLKPHNVLLTASGTPKVADFGLAKRGDTGDLTRTQAVMGTPAYMSPEQANGETKFVGPQADVWALGVILYECLTGTRPFAGADAWAVLAAVQRADFQPPRAVHPAVPRDLELVCLKCLSRDPADRYQTAGELAADLRNWLAGKPISARPAGTVETVVKWARRNPAVALLSAAVFGVLTAGVMVASVLAVRANDAAERARKNEQTATEKADEAKANAERAEAENRVARDRLYVVAVNQAQADLTAGHVTNAMSRLSEYAPNTPDAGRRGWEWHYLHRLANGAVRVHPPRKDETPVVEGAAFSPDGKSYAAVNRWGRLTMYDTVNGAERWTASVGDGWAAGLKYRPDGSVLAVWSGKGRAVTLVDAETGKTLRTLAGHTGWVGSVFWHPTKPLLAVGCWPQGDQPGETLVWDVSTGDPVHRWQKKPSYAVTFLSGEPNHLASAEPDGIEVYDVATGARVRRLATVQNATGVTFTPDGKWFAAYRNLGMNRVGELALYDAATGAKLHDLVGHTEGVRQLRFVVDGTRLISAADDHSIRVWDVTTGKQLRRLLTANDWNSALGVHPSGTKLVSGGYTHGVEVWDLDRPVEAVTHNFPASVYRTLALDPVAARSVVVQSLSTVVFDPRAERRLIALKSATNAQAAAFDPTGGVIAVGFDGGKVRLYDPATGKITAELVGPPHRMRAVAFSGDGRRLAAAYRASVDRIGNAVESLEKNDGVVVWDVATGVRVRELRHDHLRQVNSLCVSHTGDRVWSGTGYFRFRCWDVAAGEPVGDGYSRPGFSNWESMIRASGDGRKLFVSTQTDQGLVFDADTWQQRVLVGHTKTVRHAAFTPDNRRLATASDDGTVRLWDVATSMELLSLPLPDGRPADVQFSSDGWALTAATDKGTIRVWDARPVTAAEQTSK